MSLRLSSPVKWAPYQHIPQDVANISMVGRQGPEASLSE